MAGQSKAKSIAIVACGNFLEMFDFMMFGYYASWIGRAFFPTSSEFALLMLPLATFGAGFLMRPVGAIILGAYVDKHGRRSGLLLTLGLMGLGTLSIACMPTYATIGLIAPLLVVLGRLLQGFSAGAEVGGVSVYLSEIATPNRKGFYVSWQSASQQVAVIFASLLGIAVSTFVPANQLSSWGWRIPFIVGCLLLPFLFSIRRSLEETPAFLARRHRPSVSAILSSMVANWKIVALGTMLATMTTVAFYLITAYTPTYGASELHLTSRASLLVSLCVGISNFVLLPVMGAFSDVIGRRPLLIGATTLAILTAYPALSWLVAGPSLPKLLAVQLWFSLLYSSYNGAMVVYLTEVMPAEVRAAGFSLAYSLATAIFGGFTPAICTYLIHISGNRAVPGLWLSIAALIGFSATILLPMQRISEKQDKTATLTQAEAVTTN